MSLWKKFILILALSIVTFTITTLWALYFFYTSYFKIYLVEKIKTKDEITLDYINEIIEKQTLDDIDNIFSDVEIEFFELLEDNEWKIPLANEKNRDIVINYLVKSWVTPKYIEEILPTNNFEKIISSIKEQWSPESNFINRLILSILITDGIVLFVLFLILFVISRKIILPIRQATRELRTLDVRKPNTVIHYGKKDEIWTLIEAINKLSERINVQETIRNRLLADISHELKTPITSIQTYLEWINDGIIKLDSKVLKSITEEMKRLIDLVNQIMDFEKFENISLELNLWKENISNIVKEINETHKNKLKQNHQRVKVAWDDNLEILVDKNLFKQVVHNIIGNFLKYAGRETLLTVNITKNYIDFTDNGKWVKAQEIPFLTEKFYQSSNEKTGDIKERWIGVWLSVVLKIIEAHGWKYQIKSDIGKWFSFKVIF